MAGRRLIFAISGADERLGRDALRVLRAHGLTYLEEVEVAEGRTRILQCLERFDDVAVVLASQWQMNVEMRAEDFDLFSTAGPSGDRVVVPILKNEEYGTEYIASICSLGLYLALYEKDAVLDQVAALILHGRGKAAARDYYGVSTDSVIGQAGRIKAQPASASGEKLYEEEPKKKDRKRKSSRNEKKKDGEAPRLVPGDYAVISTNVGVGCTFQSMMFAASVKRAYKDLKVAVVELDSAEQNMKVLCMQALDRMNVHGINSFDIGGVSYYFDTRMDVFLSRIRPQFDVVIYDVGFCDNETIAGIKKMVNRVFVVSDVNEWHKGELNEFVQDMNTYDRDREFAYLFPCMTNQIISDAISCLDGSRGYAVGYEASPFDPSKKTASLLVSLLGEKLPEIKYPKAIGFPKRVRSGGTVSQGSGLWKITTLLLLLVTVFLFVHDKMKYDALFDEASAVINQANENIEILNQSVASYEKEAAALTRQVLRLKEDAFAGEELNWSMVESVEVKSEEEQDVFLSLDDTEGKVFCVSLSAGSILYDYMLVEEVEEAPPIVVTIGGAIDD